MTDRARGGTTTTPAAAALPAERRGRPRNAAVDTAVVETVLRLLEEGVTMGELSMERIARETGVGKATLYRRWSGKEELMLDVLRSMEDADPELPGTSARDDLVVLLEMLRRRGLAKRSSAVLRTVISQVQAHPRLWKEYHETVILARRETVHAVLRRGMTTGELRSDVDVQLLSDLFVSPMLSRAMLHEWHDLPEGLAEEIVDAVMEGARPRAERPAG
ncbi:TetR/AcrR family transcriptional regulator C-terminal ligand-binding domain-containing protein [Streptomyces olivoreticuli]|uniref:TetR/AcrR family transcriptional regulator C-terminal ligand-binding domain-containing protein n=1 Tax=Streptomyces olivoreticuli TaxID=68246 RepID=UPI00265AEBD4|nr:TetR/AcrR family transcriptional regulator C-terminal ligand-binding domain-containing protein [Streptomyces olivoreticuli]WKK22284.1 TetR/AcrR family transcriptional regulator C-terminal ligand-binding domain-containing protein [Streptomyces olivoreticuli]